MDSVAPNIFVKDIEKTIEFYKILGFTLDIKVPEEGDIVFALMTSGKVTFLFQTFASLGEELPEISRHQGGSLLLYIKLNDVKGLHNRIKEEVNIIKDLETTFYGATEFSIQDLNGYVLTFAEDN